MSSAADVAAKLAEIAQLLELLGEDRFRVLANQRAARTFEGFTGDLSALVRDRAALLALDGVGPKIADKVIECCASGSMAELDELRARVPAGVAELLSIPGLGPKTARALWQTLGVTSLAGLKTAIDDGSILTLPRMGGKAVEKLRASIAVVEEGLGRWPMGLALPLARQIVAHLAALPGTRRIEYAGSLRRGRETVGDLDVLIATDDAPGAIEAFCAMPGVRQVISRGESKCSVRLSRVPRAGAAAAESVAPGAPEPTEETTEAPGADAAQGPAARLIQADLRIIPLSAWGAALMYFTGSKEHNVRLRERALKMGLTLNDYGLFPDDDDPLPPQQRGVAPLAAQTEQDVFARLGLPWIPPEIREDRGEIALSQTPRLIEAGDLRAELHAHTTASDGSLSIDALAQAARARGFHTLAVTDHSQSSAIAGGLKPAALREHARAVRAAAARFDDLTLLAGSEVDILADGRLDYDDEVLAELDVVVASPHAALTQDPAAATARLLRAVEHPLVNILGHPTGRLIGRRAGLAPDLAAIFAAAARRGVALEINAHWLRLDLRDAHVRAAVEAGCLIAINCDVHGSDDFDHALYGVLTGRRGWLTPERCVNCWDAAKLRAWLRRGR